MGTNTREDLDLRGVLASVGKDELAGAVLTQLNERMGSIEKYLRWITLLLGAAFMQNLPLVINTLNGG